MKKIIYILVLLIAFTGCSVKPEDGVASLEHPEKLIVIDIDTQGQSLPDTKKEGKLPVKFKIKSGKETFKSNGTIAVQGSSTAKWPKKNWKLRFFEDENLENKTRLKIGDSIPSDKWVAKAEWIDPSMLRNHTSFTLWKSMVESRETDVKYEVDNAPVVKYEGAQGFPQTFPAQVKVNGKHYGISVLLLGHDPNNFNIDKENEEHLYMDFDARGGYTDTKTWKKFSKDGIGTWLNSYQPKTEDLSDKQIEAIDDFAHFINSPIEEFSNDFDRYLDKDNMIDLLLFTEMIYDWDAVAQDIEIVTYDLQKWYFLPWDKDTTFGLWWDGTGLIENSEEKLIFNYQEMKEEQMPWYKTYVTHQEDIEERYQFLRDHNIFSVENIENITDNYLSKIPQKLWEEEYNRWEEDGRPSVEELTQEQLLLWFEKRLEILDEHFNYKAQP